MKIRLGAGLIALLSCAITASSAAAIGVQAVDGGHTFNSPVYVAFAPGDDSRMYVVERSGTVQLVKDGTTQATPFLDIHTVVRSSASEPERGLLSIAFPPGYPGVPYFFVAYTGNASATAPANGLGDLVVSRISVSSNPDLADASTEQKLLVVPRDPLIPFTNHNAGQLQFGPDDDLYVSTGDGGSGGAPPGNAQNRGSPVGNPTPFAPPHHTGTSAIYTPAAPKPFVGRAPAAHRP